MDSHPVIVVGSANADLTSFVERAPERGETLIGSDFSMAAGGKGANQAIAVSRAGARCVFVGCVGADPFANLIREGLEGVDTRFLREVPGEGTGIAHIRVDARGENDIVVVPRANARLTTADVDRALEAEGEAGGVMLLQLETPIDVAVHAARAAHARGMTVILDPAPAQPLPEEIWASVDIVTPNEGEARVLTGEADPAAASRWFLERGVGAAILTLAGAGASVVTAEGSRIHEPFPVDAVDTTAAGDAFAGALAAGLAGGLGLDPAVRRAMAAGALAVTREGAAPSIPTAAEIDGLLGS
ncbi:ribokinase [Microbacterium sorbitolivorans]|uniref:Ribokinase n=1 Tax=Microbacterium sorbitolivorans TaxID=1867410 RepID=A0A367Y2I5_9MICO|nr:ribokinase [Microbacterium sorbitolivorans]RCK60106.1 ribokinase [Microbacterium sorbitolivorans]GGF42837.1 ribokinase [Microbacterium sorbitolivorans]